MQQLTNQLQLFGFTPKFCEFAKDYFTVQTKLKEDTIVYIVGIDNPNALKMTLEDFAKHSNHPTSCFYTNISVDTFTAESNSETKENKPSEESEYTKLVTSPGIGIHRHKNYNIYLCVEVHSFQPLIVNSTPRFINRTCLINFESLDLTDYYLKQLQIINQPENTIKLFTLSGNEWSQSKIPCRASSTLFVEKVWDDMIADAREFLLPETRAWYHAHGIPYKRGFLIHGLPGGGKSTSIRVLATELNKPLYNLTLSQSHLDDATFIELMHEVMPGSIVAIEDLDHIFSNHNVNVSQSTVSFATLLNVLDGNLSKEGSIIVFTCNKIDYLDDAFLRCGRIDAIFEFKSASEKMREKMLLSFYPETTPDEAKQFLKAIKDVRELSLSTLQGFFIANRKSTIKEAIENASKNIGFFHRRSLKRKGEFE